MFIFTFKKYIEKILHICLVTDRETMNGFDTAKM